MTANIEKRVRETFASLTPPPELNERTLAHIEASRELAKPAKAVRGFSFAKLAVAACLALACLGAGTLAHQWSTAPTAYIGIDLNPSVELEVNRFDKVVGARALNDDGAAVLEELVLIGLPADEALEQVTGSNRFEAYAGDDGFVCITVACENRAQQARLAAYGENCTARLACEGACQTADEDDWAAAQAAGMGMGRYLAAQELMTLDPTVTLEDCSDMTMRELRNSIAAHQEDDPADRGPVNGNTGGKGQNHPRRQGSSPARIGIE